MAIAAADHRTLLQHPSDSALRVWAARSGNVARKREVNDRLLESDRMTTDTGWMRYGLASSCLLFVACTSYESNEGCNSEKRDPPGSQGPIPEFRAVAGAPAEIDLVAIAPVTERPIVAARDGIFRYDGNDTWTPGPSLAVERFLRNGERMFAIADGAIYEMQSADFTWSPLGNPQMMKILGLVSVTGAFVAEDPSAQLLSWKPNESAWKPLANSQIPEGSTESAVGDYGEIYRLTASGELFLTSNATTTELAQDPLDPFQGPPHHLVVDTNATAFVCAGGSAFKQVLDKPHFVRRATIDEPCDKLQLLPDDSLIFYASTEEAFSGHFFHLAADSTDEMRYYMSTEYDYICGGTPPDIGGKFYGAIPIDSDRSFIESMDFGTF